MTRLLQKMRLWADKHLGWHRPTPGVLGFDGCSVNSLCRLCGKKIMQDSQGNWF